MSTNPTTTQDRITSTTPNPSTSSQLQKRIVIPLATDERCWFRCRQTNAGRIRAKEPLCSMFCYYSNKLPLVVMPVESSKTSALLNQSRTDSTLPTPNKSTLVDKEPMANRWDDLIDKYTFSFLEGKFLYFATGQPAVNRHLASMRKVCALERDWMAEQIEEGEALEQDKGKQKPVPRPDSTQRGLMVLAYHRDYERIINISHSIASSLATVHGHFEKIYGPTYKILSRLPSSFAQLMDSQQTSIPTQFTMIHNLFSRPLLSDSITLLNRSVESVSEVISRLATKFASSLDEKEDSTRLGKSKRPPSPPSVPPSA